MKVKLFDSNTLRTDIYTVNSDDKNYIYKEYLNGMGRCIDCELRTVGGGRIDDAALLKLIQANID